jgi:3-deoxy-manno-octulosonate cytidylyltransferase (CMP-KDO synthetase)
MMAPPIPRDEVVAVIPARFGSSRFPGKPLVELKGSPLIAHVVRAALAARRVGTVLVASDHEEILAAARAAGAEGILSSADHATGSDRIGEAVAGRSESVILNVQGDEPLIPAEAIDLLVALLEEDPEAAVSTLASPLAWGGVEHEDPNVVKVVCDPQGRALYFSRAPIPGRHPRAELTGEALRHVGLYGFRREPFLRFLARAPGELERAEGLEQLRFLEAGERIVVGRVEQLPPGVDTPEDLARIERL